MQELLKELYGSYVKIETINGNAIVGRLNGEKLDWKLQKMEVIALEDEDYTPPRRVWVKVDAIVSIQPQ